MGAVKKRNVTQMQTTYAKQQEEAATQSGQKKKRVIRRLTAFSIVAAAIAFFMISIVISQSSTLAEKSDKKEKLTAELNELKKEQTILEEEIVKLNDDEYIAKLARKDYFLSEENETIFNIPKEKGKKKSTTN